MTEKQGWDDPKYVKPADCDEDGYCVCCWSATVHDDGCIVLASGGSVGYGEPTLGAGGVS